MAVLTCMDARLEPLAMLGLQQGDAVVLRNGGGRVNDEVVGSLLVARHVLGVERLAIVGHTDCRMTARSPEALRASIADAGGPDTSELAFETAQDPESGVRSSIERIRSSRHLGGLAVEGYVYDLESGELRTV
jgi:carbonic anhydrase